VTGLPGVLRNAPLLLLSAHFDDAALSCAALIAREEPIDLLTVFAGNPTPPRQGKWDRVTGFADSGESRSVRRAEEHSAFADTPHRLAFLDLVEAEYLSGTRAQDDAKPIAAATSRWVEQNHGGVVAVPAGAGRDRGLITTVLRRMGIRAPLRHPDHLFVRDTALDAVAAANAQAVLYEEFPYLWGEAAEAEVRRITRSRGMSAERVVAQVDVRSKAARIAVYASQVPHLTVRGRRVDVAEHLPGEERYWILSP
jgi:LmbE family N-acetylglucosaminyl deacetylase